MTLHSTYGLLEQTAVVTLPESALCRTEEPDCVASRAGTRMCRTLRRFRRRRCRGSFDVTQKVKRPDTFIYDFQYRRVKVDPNTSAGVRRT